MTTLNPTSTPTPATGELLGGSPGDRGRGGCDVMSLRDYPPGYLYEGGGGYPDEVAEPEPLAPRSVLRGANNQTSTIDWFRVVIPQQHTGEVSTKFDDLFGPHESTPGRFGLRSGRLWPGGAYLAVDVPREGMGMAPHAVVELSGSTLAPLAHADKLGLMIFLLSVEGARSTRLDIAIDYHGKDIPLIAGLTVACEQGELTGAKRFEPVTGYKVVLGTPTVVKHMLTIGTRGKNGSGRYVRIYDKGLETGEQPQGSWIRWELELSKDLAQAAAVAILESDDSCYVMEEYALGACDFRQANGKRKRDRPRCAWWQLVLNKRQPRRDTMPRRKPDADRYANWLKTAALPAVYAYADALGLTVPDFIDTVTGGVTPNMSKLDTPVGMQLIRLTKRTRGKP